MEINPPAGGLRLSDLEIRWSEDVLGVQSLSDPLPRIVLGRRRELRADEHELGRDGLAGLARDGVGHACCNTALLHADRIGRLRPGIEP